MWGEKRKKKTKKKKKVRRRFPYYMGYGIDFWSQNYQKLKAHLVPKTISL